MIELTRRSGISIPRKYENESWYHQIRAHLFRRQLDYQTDMYITTKYFSESAASLIIPRYFPIHDYVECKINDISHEGKDIDIEHNIKPRNDAQITAMDYMNTHNNGMIKLGPGMGKTVISIHMIATKKKKTLIVVHRDSLDKQWRERLLQHSSISENQIALLNSNKFEEHLMEYPIVISTCQTIGSLYKRYPVEYLTALHHANFGVGIFDELHTTVGAPTFSKCSLHFPGHDTWGLSATPYRNDGNSDIIEYHLGDMFESDSDEDTMPADVTFMLLDFDIDTPRREKWLHWEGKFQRSRYLNVMKNSKVFMDLVKVLLMKLANDKRELLFISERVDKMINILYDWMPYDNKSKFIAGSGLEELEKQISFSTPGKIRDGIDVPWKDSLLVTSPVKNIEQLCGRVTRICKDRDKPTPQVIDMVDIGCEDIKKSFWQRRDYYISKGWKIQYIFINQFTYEKFKLREQDALTIIQGE